MDTEWVEGPTPRTPSARRRWLWLPWVAGLPFVGLVHFAHVLPWWVMVPVVVYLALDYLAMTVIYVPTKEVG